MIAVARRRVMGETRVIPRRHLEDLRAGAVALQFAMVGGDFSAFASDVGRTDYLTEMLSLIEAFHSELDEAHDEFRVVRWAEEVDDVGLTAPPAFVLHWEGMAPVARFPELLKLGWRLGVRSAGLTWNGPNGLADGSMVARGAGLTERGSAVVKEMNRLGMVVDVSHLADRGVADICGIAVGPIIASHSNARAVYDHPRNLRDEHIRAIADLDGVVGVCAYPPMLTPRERPSIVDIVRQADHVCDLVGARHVGFGGDFLDCIDESWFGSAPLHAYSSELTRPFAPDLDSVRKLPRLAAALTDAGYAEDDVAGIMGENFRRVLRTVLSRRPE
jgi:membrane dipeptidase